MEGWKRRVGTRLAASVFVLATIGALLTGCSDHKARDGNASAPRSEHTLGAADRAPLVERQVDGVTRLVHPTLRFSIRRPPPSFQPSPDVATILNNGKEGLLVYAYSEDPPHAILGIDVIPESDLAALQHDQRTGFESTLTRELGSALSIEWVRDDVRGDEGHLHAVMDRGHMQVVSHRMRDEDVIVSVMVMASDETILSDVLESFRREL